MKSIEYLDQIPWFQDLPENVADLESAQRFAFQKNQVLMSRHGLAPWGVLLQGTAQWIVFCQDTGKVKVLAEISAGQFLGAEDLPVGAVAVATSAGDMLLMARNPGQPLPLSRFRPLSGRRRTPGNDLPFHAYHLDQSGPHRLALDVGAGVGRFTQLLAPYCERIVSIEPDPEARQMNVERMRALGHDDFAAVDAQGEALPFQDGEVDLVASRLAIHQFHSTASFAKEVARVLRIGGLLAVTDLIAPADPDAERLLNRIESARDADHGAIVSKQALLAQFGPAFKVVAEFDSVLRISLVAWLQQAGTPVEAISRLLDDIDASGSSERSALGILEGTPSGRLAFDSRRYSVILQRV